MYRVHRLGHIEARSIELPLSEVGIRMARQSYTYLSLGFECEIEKSLGITVEGATRFRVLPMNVETLQHRVLVEDDWAKPTRR